MTPIKLTFAGIFSYQDSVTIDFQKLSRPGIFGIFGAVGSGKSAIIDAMTFVLYGDYHRSPGKNIYYNLMNLRSYESLIEFRFEHNDRSYEFRYQAKRSRSNHNNISRHSRKAYEVIGEDLIPLESNNGGKVLDLDFDEFVKLVIIPQGQFAEFINLTDGNRTKMLKKILKLDKFSLFSPTSRLLQQAREQLAFNEGHIMALGKIEPELIHEKEHFIGSARKEINNNEIKIKYLSDSIKESEHLARHSQERTHWLKEKETIDKEQAYFDQLQKDVKMYQLVQDRFYKLYHQKEIYSKQRHEIRLQLENYEERLKDTTAQYQKLMAEKKRMLSGFESIEDLQSHVNKRISYENIKQLESINKQLSSKLHIQYKKVEELAEKAKGLRKRLEDVQTEIEKNNQILSEEAVLAGQLNRFKELKKTTEQITDISVSIEQIKSELSLFSDKKNKILDNLRHDHHIMIDDKQKINKNIVELRDLLAETEREQKELETEAEQIRQLHALQNYAHHLHDGEPCPLCGSREHPHKFSNNEILLKVKSIEESLTGSRKKYDDIKLCINNLESIIELYRIKDMEMKREQSRTDKLNEEKAELEQDTFGLDENAIRAKLDSLQTLKSRSASCEEIKKTLLHELKSTEETLAGINLASIENDMNRHQGQIDTLKQSINPEEFESFDDSQLNLEELTEQINRLRALDENEKKLSLDTHSLNTRLTAIHEQQDNAERQYTDAENMWQTQLSEQGLAHEEVIRILHQELIVQNELSRINAFNEKKGNILFKINELNSIIKDRTYHADAHHAMADEKAQLEKINNELSARIEVSLDEIRRIRINIDKQKKLLEEKESIDKRAANLSLLSSLFRGDKFVQFVSRQYTRHLFMLANKRFKKLTFNQLELSIDEDGHFSIVDYMNDKRERSIKTLSGGQLFQASLCLALALSEQLQLIQNQHQQFFFIDEGFGTLDKDSLNIVLETLKELRSEGRTVGIISHVDELRQEIDFNIQVNRHPEKGSFIKMNY